MVIKKSKVIFFSILLLINILFSKFFVAEISFQEIFIFHVFLFSLMLLTDLIQLKSLKKKGIISYFLTLNFLRIFLCLLFLSPIIFSHKNSNKIYIYNFFIIYFIYLFYNLNFKQKKGKKINM